jgi:hypothetical protein
MAKIIPPCRHQQKIFTAWSAFTKKPFKNRDFFCDGLVIRKIYFPQAEPLLKIIFRKFSIRLKLFPMS